MNVKSILLGIAAGAILAACSGTPAPVDSRGNVLPSLQSLPARDSLSGVESQALESKTYVPQYNQDGSLTMFSVNGFNFKMLPMTDGRTRGALNRSTDEFDALIAQYTDTVKNNPQDFESCIMLAGLYIDRGNPGDATLAVQYSNQALALGKNDSQALYARGLAYAEQGDNPKALVDLKAVLKSDIQTMKGVYYVMGMLHYKDGKVEEAIEAFEKIQALDPEFVDTDEILKELYVMRG